MKPVGVGSRFDAQGEVFLQLAVEALLDMAGGDVFAVLAEERRIVDREKHRHRRFVDGDRGAAVPDSRSRRSYRRFRIRRCRSGRRFHRRALHRPFFLPKPSKTINSLMRLFCIVTPSRLARVTFCPVFRLSARHFTHGDTADVGGVFERGDKHLGRALHDGGFRNFVEDGVQQRRDRVRRLIPDMGHPALFGRAVDGFVVEPARPLLRAKTSGRKPVR